MGIEDDTKAVGYTGTKPVRSFIYSGDVSYADVPDAICFLVSKGDLLILLSDLRLVTILFADDCFMSNKAISVNFDLVVLLILVVKRHVDVNFFSCVTRRGTSSDGNDCRITTISTELIDYLLQLISKNFAHRYQKVY